MTYFLMFANIDVCATAHRPAVYTGGKNVIPPCLMTRGTIIE